MQGVFLVRKLNQKEKRNCWDSQQNLTKDLDGSIVLMLIS